jgi:dihydroorotate dehydrogenase electron transfer subunit
MPPATTLFYGARSEPDLYYADFFGQLGAHLVLTTEDGTRGERGRVTAPLERALARRDAARPLTIYACGPTPMMRAVADIGRRAGRPVYVSLEPVMGCGMGGCYSCVVRVRKGPDSRFVRSCLDGPVFDAGVLEWQTLATGH